MSFKCGPCKTIIAALEVRTLDACVNDAQSHDHADNITIIIISRERGSKE